MRIFYATLAIVLAILLTLKPELATEILAGGLVVAGLLTLLPTK